MSVDLNCHTKLSDGSMGIDDLIILAEKRGIKVVSITDKDCQAGNVRAKLLGERHGVRVISGVELSSVDQETGREVSIFCYLADSPDRLEGLCRKNTVACRRASQYMAISTAKK
ncbi:MAG: PHP domain-containing protein, partial [Clostridia bacterium]|nr:PHP domain-containing protein [Clostridia bacterium]